MKKYIMRKILILCIVVTMFPSKVMAGSEAYLWPVPGSTNIHSGYCPKNRPNHHAIDITGGSDIVASKDGKVIAVYTGCTNYSRKNGRCKASGKCDPNVGYSNGSASKDYCNFGYGNGVIIKHTDGSGYSMYAHMSTVKVKEDSTVSQGTKLGTMGSTGNSDGKHLHFEVSKGMTIKGSYYEPKDWINTQTLSYIYKAGETQSKPEVESKITITPKNASKIAETSARVDASCSYSGTRPSQVSVYVGTSKSNMKKYEYDKITHTKNPFDIWYTVKGLKSGTKYYYQFHATVNGVDKAYGDIKSFTTAVKKASLAITVKGSSKITKNSARVDASCSYSGTRPSQVSVYVGTSKSNMKKYEYDKITHTKNPFNIWYTVKGLKSGTKYYYQFHATVNGVDKAYGDIKKFTTAK